MALTFHWRLLHGGESGSQSRAAAALRRATGIPDVPRQVAFCRRAEAHGFAGLLTDIGAAKPDPIVLATALGCSTSSIEFIIACRSGLMPPTTFVQQLNTLSTMIDGRFRLNVVAGHSPAEQRFYGDFGDHAERYARTDEYLQVCRALWTSPEPVTFEGKYVRVENAVLNTPFVSPRRPFPELFIAGGSPAARALAISQGTLWMRLADAPDKIAAEAAPVLVAGKEVGVRMAVIARPTFEEALAAGRALVAERDPTLDEDQRENAFIQRSDSVSFRAAYEMAQDEWLAPNVWTGAVRTHGAPTIALVGSYDEVADALMRYADAGVTQFILSGWPKLEEMERFGEHVLPRVRTREQAAAAVQAR